MQDVDRLSARHIAKLLSKLEQINTPSIIKDEVKRHFYFFANDIKNQVLVNYTKVSETERQ